MSTIKIALGLLSILFVFVDSAPVQRYGPHNTVKCTLVWVNGPTETLCEEPWVGTPTRRGTIDLLFSCILTLFLCIWTTIHTNIEPDVWWVGKRAERKRRIAKSTSSPHEPAETLSHIVRINIKLRKLVWSFGTLLFPEIALLVATHERKTALLLYHEMRGILNTRVEDQGTWDMALSYYTIMGGFVVEQEITTEPWTEYKELAAEDKEPRVDDKNFGEVDQELTIQPIQGQGTTAGMNREAPTGLTKLELRDLDRRCTLTPEGLLYIVKNKGVSLHIRPEAVNDKNKASLLTKILVCVQAVSMIIQVIGRYIEDLPVALLELYTVLHAFCALLMYITWIKKPVDIEQPTFIPLHPDILRELRSHDGLKRTAADIFWHKEFSDDCLTSRAGLGKLLFRQVWDLHGTRGFRNKCKLLFRAYEAICSGWREFAWEAFTLSIVGILHGGLHLAALADFFPSESEIILWLLTSSLTAVAVFLFCASVLIGPLFKRLLSDSNNTSVKVLGYLGKAFLAIYFLCFLFASIPVVLSRVYLLFESFVSIRQLHDGAYDKTQWAGYFPIFGS